MEYKVDVTHQAFDEIDDIFGFIKRRSPQNAVRWREQLLEKIYALAAHPLLHGLAPEAQSVGAEVRQKLFGNYRILYTVSEDAVTIHGVRHTSRRELRPDELPG